MSCPYPRWDWKAPPSQTVPGVPTVQWGVALSWANSLSHCELSGQQGGFPGREGGGRACGMLSAWPLLGPPPGPSPPGPGSGPGAMSSGSSPQLSAPDLPPTTTPVHLACHCATLPPPRPQFLLPPPLNPCGIINPRCGIRQLDLNFQNHNAFELENSRTTVRKTRKFQDHQVLEHFPFQAQDLSEPNNFKNAASRNQRSKPQKRI